MNKDEDSRGYEDDWFDDEHESNDYSASDDEFVDWYELIGMR